MWGYSLVRKYTYDLNFYFISSWILWAGCLNPLKLNTKLNLFPPPFSKDNPLKYNPFYFKPNRIKFNIFPIHNSHSRKSDYNFFWFFFLCLKVRFSSYFSSYFPPREAAAALILMEKRGLKISLIYWWHAEIKHLDVRMSYSIIEIRREIKVLGAPGKRKERQNFRFEGTGFFGFLDSIESFSPRGDPVNE